MECYRLQNLRKSNGTEVVRDWGRDPSSRRCDVADHIVKVIIVPEPGDPGGVRRIRIRQRRQRSIDATRINLSTICQRRACIAASDSPIGGLNINVHSCAGAPSRPWPAHAPETAHSKGEIDSRRNESLTWETS